MQTSKSYTLPKLVLLNILALIMMRFEHEVPARNHVQSNAHSSDSLIETKGLKVAELENNHQRAVQKTPVAKKREVQKYASRQSNHLEMKTRYNAANTPIGCCFRGNL